MIIRNIFKEIAGVISPRIDGLIAKFGSPLAGNYSEFEADGTIHMVGNATVHRDEYGFLLAGNITSPAQDIVLNEAEGSLTFKTSCRLVDYVTMQIQLNHDRKHGADLEFHLHWWQVSANIPNWLIQYRYQRNGYPKVTAWTSKKYSSHVFTYTTGTLNQITTFGTITPPENDNVSDILQIRIIRDFTNQSTLFAGTDPQNTNIDAMAFDVHKEIDTIGSRQTYPK